MDFFHSQPAVLHFRHPDIRNAVGWCHEKLPLLLFRHVPAEAHQLRPAEARAKLHEIARSVGMQFVHQLFYGAEEFLLFFIKIPAAGLHAGHAGDDETDIAFRTFQIIITDFRVEFSVITEQPGSAHRRQDDTVFQGNAADFNRRKKSFISAFHTRFLSRIMVFDL